MIDTHCHLTNGALSPEADDVIDRARDAGVDRMISVAISPDDAGAAISLASRLPHVWATAGVHPSEAARWAPCTALTDRLRELLAHPRVVALGEIGLDTHYSDPPLGDQTELLDCQLALAASSNAPIIIHNRGATDLILRALDRGGVCPSRCVFHCFSGSGDELDAILDAGAMVSYTGLITFGNAEAVAQCAARTPLDRMMIETDAPFLTPVPHRKTRPNEPRFLPHVANFLAGVLNHDVEELTRRLDGNAERFFGLGVGPR